jgi:hypothetical protein
MTVDQNRRVAAHLLAGHVVANGQLTDLSCVKPDLILSDLQREAAILAAHPAKHDGQTTALLVGVCAARWGGADEPWKAAVKPLLNKVPPNIEAKATALALKNESRIKKLAEALARRGSMRAGEIARLIDVMPEDRCTTDVFASARTRKPRTFKQRKRRNKKGY